MNGAKMWITKGSLAGLAVVWAAMEVGIRASGSRPARPEFSATPIEQKVSLRASVTAALFWTTCSCRKKTCCRARWRELTGLNVF